MYQLLHSINKKIYTVEKWVMMLLLLGMSLFVFMQVIFRFVLSQPLAWSEELTTYMFSWLTYIGACVVLYHDGHVAITSVVDGIKSESLKKGVLVLRQLIILAFFVLIAYIAFDLAGRFIVLDQRLTNLPEIPVGYIFLQVPISAASMALFTLERIIIIIWPQRKADGDGNDELITGGASC